MKPHVPRKSTLEWEFPKIRGSQIDPNVVGLLLQGHLKTGLPFYGNSQVRPALGGGSRAVRRRQELCSTPAEAAVILPFSVTP